MSETDTGGVWIIVPVKPLDEGKSRLASILAPEERRDLSRRLLLHTLHSVGHADGVAGVLVVSRDDGVLSLAREAGAVSVVEAEADDRGSTLRRSTLAKSQSSEPEVQLNRALEQARAEALRRGASAILVLPTDLPLLSGEEIEALCRRYQRHERVLVIAPSGTNGTNALLMSPPNLIDFAYGMESFFRHKEQGERLEVPVDVVHSDVLAFDLDCPEDLRELKERLRA